MKIEYVIDDRPDGKFRVHVKGISENGDKSDIFGAVCDTEEEAIQSCRRMLLPNAPDDLSGLKNG